MGRHVHRCCAGRARRDFIRVVLSLPSYGNPLEAIGIHWNTRKVFGHVSASKCSREENSWKVADPRYLSIGKTSAGPPPEASPTFHGISRLFLTSEPFENRLKIAKFTIMEKINYFHNSDFPTFSNISPLFPTFSDTPSGEPSGRWHTRIWRKFSHN